MPLRDWLIFCLNSGWQKRDLIPLARVWWRQYPDDKGDTGKFVIRYHKYELPIEFFSRRAAVAWGLWNYKGSHAGWTVRPDSVRPEITMGGGWINYGGNIVPCPCSAVERSGGRGA